MLDWLRENPILVNSLLTGVTAIIAFMRPIMAALQRALVRRIESAWQDVEPLAENHDDHIQRTIAQLRHNSLFPIPSSTVERQVRIVASMRPPKTPHT